MNKPVVCVDLSPVAHRKAGLATYARALAAELPVAAPDLAFRAFVHGSRSMSPLPEPVAAWPRTELAWGSRRWRLSAALRTLFGPPMNGLVMPGVAGPAVFHATEHLLPPLRDVPGVFTFHDAIYALFPQFHLRMNLWFLNLMMPRFLRRAAAIIVVSECSRRDCVRLYGVDEARLTVIHEAVDPAWQRVNDPREHERVRAKHKLPGRFMLYFGTLEPRKNLVTLLHALRAMVDDTWPEDAPHLVIAGRTGWLAAPIFEAVRTLRLEGHVTFTGYVPAEDAAALMSAATLFVFPSLYEGFGLPPLEAMACGIPVVCANTSSLPEVVGDAAVLVDPRQPAALAAAMRSVWLDAALRNDLAARGSRQVARFAWPRAARETAQVYRQVLNHHEH